MSINTSIINVDPKKNIIIKGAKLHNLKNIDVVIPRNKLVVITGLSGSGKSSLAFDTLYAEGQRRYVESLSSYARQFLGRLNKPKVDFIKGIAPAIAIEQKVNSTNPRSTVGTTTEIYDYLKLLFARIGKTYSPKSGDEVKKDTVSDVINHIKSFDEGEKLLLLAPIHLEEGRTMSDKLKVLYQQGYARVKVNDTVIRIDEYIQKPNSKDVVFLVIDRVITKHDEDFFNRLADAIQTAFFEGKGQCYIESLKDNTQQHFSNKFELDGISFLEPNIHLFSFNNPYGACPKCEGYGDVIGIDGHLVVPNTGLSIYENAIFAWRGESMSWYRDQLVNNSHKFDFPIHKPYFELTLEQKQLIWTGNEYFEGLNSFFEELESKAYKIQNRVMLSRYRGKTKCNVCNGKRLRPEANYVKISNATITDLVEMPLNKLVTFFQQLELNDYDTQIAKRLLKEISNRLSFLTNVGLNYLTLNRKSNTLSGGESQRINLATSLGSSLVGSMYILDEPSIGLHPRDTERLITVLKSLRDLGNTVIVVEHDEDIMAAADEIIDIGPEAGTFGGEVVATGSYNDILNSDSLTAKYLNGTFEIETPKERRTSKYFVDIKGAREHNLKNIDVTFPLGMLTVITGVSGSGKSTLVKKILHPALIKEIGSYGDKPGEFTSISGNFSNVKHIEFVDQNPIGRSSRSNPVTYIKAYDDIRALYSKQKLSTIRGYQAKHFSFNVDGGRCETCKGEGEVTIEMQFMADVHLECETCKGKRFKKEVLEVAFEGKTIDDILNMTIDDAISFFEETAQTKIKNKLQPLQDVGLGYVTLGQSSSTLSGGEAQRIKLATFLGKGNTKETALFIFDEPTTGLHFHDIKKLLKSFNALIEKGHSIIVVEHNVELIKCADYIIDLGPEGGENGGQLLASGTPEEVAKSKASFTGKYLKDKL
ncbi:excinuclease ABC subunit UvrA [Flavobacteriaceae bacterium S0825]|uniref:excinuclease ABC subunit UvrA n=1 Tax=Gaetbulibacter sp. S0825 TaxID=2720084 RepID=UPI001430BC11|nr:excinuclease ABC subunit UvrA [Gaetbulibacter sp. S0825]MCK0109646.1 excinuclease ABC subunit UvrA [Flavobacteriaceae bacterium S0825]NIX65279.1 excinuclease ABC subunit UvrA [Gaetbulibacter sp. S0825]